MIANGEPMEELQTHSLHVESIRRDLDRIIDEWLHLHLRLAAILVAISLVVESGIAFFITKSQLLTTTIERYILKFIIAPSGSAALCLLVAVLAVHSKRLSSKAKASAKWRMWPTGTAKRLPGKNASSSCRIWRKNRGNARWEKQLATPTAKRCAPPADATAILWY